MLSDLKSQYFHFWSSHMLLSSNSPEWINFVGTYMVNNYSVFRQLWPLSNFLVLSHYPKQWEPRAEDWEGSSPRERRGSSGGKRSIHSPPTPPPVLSSPLRLPPSGGLPQFSHLFLDVTEISIWHQICISPLFLSTRTLRKKIEPLQLF